MCRTFHSFNIDISIILNHFVAKKILILYHEKKLKISKNIFTNIIKYEKNSRLFFLIKIILNILII